jgi:gas vesicle protein
VNNQNWTPLLTGAAIGAGAMFLLDPNRGGRRRALIRDQAVRASRKTTDALDALGHDAANRARGLAAESWTAMRGETVDSRKLVERVRAELGRVVSHPRAIDVAASEDGCVCLTGPILSEEADDAVAAIGSVRGVCSVEDQLDRHMYADIPSLQGGRARPGRMSALTQASWSPTTTALFALGGTALAVGLGYATMHGGDHA